MNRRSYRLGVTLSEVLIVIAILMVLACISFVVTGAVQRAGQVSTCSTHLRSLHVAIELYRADNGNANETVGTVSRLGLPPLWLNLATSKPVVGELTDWLCPAPKSRLEDYVPHYIYPPDIEFAWPGQPTKDRRTYYNATALYKERTPLIVDVNHNNHATTPMELPRVDKHVIWIDLGGRLNDQILTKPFYPTNHPDFFAFFELD